MNSNELLTLGDLKINEQAEVVGFKKNKKKEVLDKLLALGINRGSSIRLLRFAPLGDPIDIEVKGTNISLRGSEAKLVLVRRK